MENKKLSARQINGLLKKYEARKKEDYSNSKRLTKEDYIKGNYSFLRNPIIANVFRRLNIIEAFATGIRRINASYNDSLVKPIYDVTSSAISVTLPIIDSNNLSLNEKMVYGVMKQNYSYSRADLEKLSGFPRDTLIRILNGLIEKGVLEKNGSGRATTYKLNK